MMVGLTVASTMIATAAVAKTIVNKRKKKAKKSGETLEQAINRGYAEIDALNQMLNENKRDEQLIREEIEKHAGRLADMMEKQNKKQEIVLD